MRAQRTQRKQQVGVVTSDRMDKTRVVRVETRRRDPIYKKTVRYGKTYKVHDEGNESRTGDTVVIAETRPLSKEKRWRLVRVLQRRRLAEPIRDDAAEAEAPAASGGQG